MKRGMDLTLVLLIAGFLAPALLLIAAGIKLDSRGPVLYRQLRHGRANQVVCVFKFRTMHADLCDPPDAPIVQATRDDRRVTRVGRVLRRTNLDELPQLLNVLNGTMSLVGPRPHPVAFLDTYAGVIANYGRRHEVKPGITGWAQVHGLRGETRTVEDMGRRIEYDEFYVRNRSLLLDLRILLMTLATFRSRNAY